MIFKLKNIFIILTLLTMNFYTFADGKTPGNPFSQTGYMPDIAFIFDFAYIGRDYDNNDLAGITIPGFSHSHSHAGHTHVLLKNGFNLSYGELSLYSYVDPYFDLFTTFHLSENSFEIEEVYIRTQKIPFGIQFKMGKFLSSFGRINAQHAHYWNFFENPLVYKTIFGTHGLLEKGVQMNWLAPTDMYILFGVEVMAGENENCFGRDGFEVETSNESIGIEDSKFANSYTFYIKSSVDIGDLTLLYGVSYISGKARLNHLEDSTPHAFYGDTSIIGFDLTAKYQTSSYKFISFQGEYIGRNMKGTKYMPDSFENNIDEIGYEKQQSGFYSQIIYKFHKLWQTGVRYDSIFKNDAFIDLIKNKISDKLYRFSFVLEYKPTEFSRIRLQYNYNNYQFFDNVLKKNNEFILNFNFTIGAHGAHSF